MYDIFINVLIDFNGNKITFDEIKKILTKQYTIFLKTYSKEIYKTLQIQGKTDLISKVKRKENTLIELINQKDYYLTNLDLIILFKKYKIPVIFISATKLKENNKSAFVVNYLPETRYYYIIKQYGVVLNNNQKYGIIMLDRNIKIDILSFENDFSDHLETNILESPFIKEIKKKKIVLLSKKSPPKKKKKKLIIL